MSIAVSTVPFNSYLVIHRIHSHPLENQKFRARKGRRKGRIEELKKKEARLKSSWMDMYVGTSCNSCKSKCLLGTQATAFFVDTTYNSGKKKLIKRKRHRALTFKKTNKTR
jgi:hypothetical protein